MHLLRLALASHQYPKTQRYPFNLALFQRTKELVFDRPVTLFVGENGTGKSTLLRAIARSAGIHIWQFEGGDRIEPNPFEETLCNYLVLEWAKLRVPGSFFASDRFRDFSQLLEDWGRLDPGQLRPFGGRSLLTQSHGQSLMTYFTHRYQLPGLYLLDEPETALSPARQLEFVRLLAERGASGEAQFVVATHSPLVMSCPGARLLSFDGESVQAIEYEQTEHYRVYRDFFRERGAAVGS